MQRVVSFVILVALALVIGFFFFRVMAAFLLPMFFAAILVVIFRPLHLRLVERCKGRIRLAAGLSTLTILAIVLLPLLLLTVRAGMDGYALAEKINAVTIEQTIGQLRSQLGIASPPDDVVNALGDLRHELESARSTLETKQMSLVDEPASENQVDPLHHDLANADEHLTIVTEYLTDYRARAAQSDSADTPWNNPASVVDIDQAEVNVSTLEDQLEVLGELLPTTATNDESATDFNARLKDSVLEAAHLQEHVLGGELTRWVKARGNMDVEELQAIVYSFAAPGMVVSRASRVGGALAETIIALVVTVLSLYYFLADGPAMVDTAMQLSPLDDRYERAMLAEFNRISWAVVVATLSSAVVQGLLAGVGYYFAGLEAVFLLTLLTMMLAMVPFVGAASVWGSCCVYLLLVGEPWTAAILAVYGACVVSVMDNIIKPYVLHGQSNLHPLLALLSVLGGAKALGPIGILVGPMVVAFLQAVLNMLRVEITELEDADHAADSHDDGVEENKAQANDSTVSIASSSEEAPTPEDQTAAPESPSD